MKTMIMIVWTMLIAVACIAGQAWALSLAPGDSVSLSGTTAAARPELEGVVIQDDVSPFEIRDNSGTVLFQGNLQLRVVRSDRDKTLDFYYRIRDTNVALPGKIHALQVRSFTGMVTDVDFRTDGLGQIGPSVASRSADGRVTFRFTPDPLLAGQESRFFFVKTNSVSFAATGLATLVGTDNNAVALAAVEPAIPHAVPQTKVKVMPKVQSPAEESAGIHGVAVLAPNSLHPGSQLLTTKYVNASGQRVGSEVVIDLAAIEEVWTDMVIDGFVASKLDPGSIFLLTGTGRLVGLRGIWGTNGTLQPPRQILIWGPFYDHAVIGAPTAIAEGMRGFEDPILFEDPIVGFEDPIVGFEDPILFEDPIVGFEDPILGIGTAGGFVGFVGVGTPAEWKDGGGFFKGVKAPIFFKEPLFLGDPVQRLTTLRQQDYFGFVALMEGPGADLVGIDPGQRFSQEGTGPEVIFTIASNPSAAPLTSITGQRLRFADADNGGVPGLPEQPLVVTNGGSNAVAVRFIPSNATGSLSLQDFKGFEVSVFSPLVQLATGSLWGVSADGHVVFLPGYSPETGELLEPQVFVLGRVSSVDIGPAAYNLTARGKYVTVVIEAQEAIDPKSVRLAVKGVGGPLTPSPRFQPTLADEDGDGDLELVVKFDRSALVKFLEQIGVGKKATLVVNWTYVDGVNGQFTTTARIVH